MLNSCSFFIFFCEEFIESDSEAETGIELESELSLELNIGFEDEFYLLPKSFGMLEFAENSFASLSSSSFFRL